MKNILATVIDIFAIKPILLVDVGARWGVQRPWNNFPEAHLKYFGFDADRDECARLNASNQHGASVVYFPTALFDIESDCTLHLTEEEGCSSVYEPNRSILDRYFLKEHWNIKKELSVRTTTLEKVFTKHSITPDFLKIDTQGAELKILSGSGSCLDSVLGLELEVEFLEMYKGQPLFSDVDVFVRKNGFELFDLNRYWANRNNMDKYHFNRGQVVFGDAIYFRTPESLYPAGLSLEQRKERVLKMVLVLSLYGFFDAAEDYVNHSSSPLSNEEKTFLSKTLAEASVCPAWHKLFLNNWLAAKVGRFFTLVGSYLSFPLNTYGWGTDYNAVDGRFPYFRREGKYFKK